VLAELRRRGISLKPEPPPRPKPLRRPVTLMRSVAVSALSLSESRMLAILQAQLEKAPDEPVIHATYNAFETGGVRRKSIPPGLRALEALGIIAVKRAPFNARKHRYDANLYRLVDGWHAFEPEAASLKAKQAALAAAKDAARKARKTERPE
jgi:hypothetical protein